MQYISNDEGDGIRTFGPSDIFHYIYSLLFSNTYRTRYLQFLKIDFPCIPLTSDSKLFRSLYKLGKQLVNIHLFESTVFDSLPLIFSGKGDFTVTNGYPKYRGEKVLINNSQFFNYVPQEVWVFQIGGYQVCHKWLKDRRGRKLSEEEIIHYQKIIVALKETIRLMGEIDQEIEKAGGWPIK